MGREKVGVPRFASVFLQHAKNCGLAASIVVEHFKWELWPWREEAGAALLLRCEGSIEKFRRLGMFGESFPFVPGRRCFEIAAANGYTELRRDGTGVLGIYLCKPPRSVENLGGVEKVCAGDFDLYHGTREQLAEHVTAFEARFPGKNFRSFNIWSNPRSLVRRLPDGTYLLMVENDDCVRRREEERERERQEKLREEDERARAQRKVPETREGFRSTLIHCGESYMDALLLIAAGKGIFSIAHDDRQRIVRMREELKVLLSRVTVIGHTDGEAPSVRCGLRLVVNNVAQVQA